MIDMPQPSYRVGIGTDIHRLTDGLKLMLCGVYVPYEAGLEGHSDADVGIHAIIDALLGAAGLSDIGTLFPDTDANYKGADSKGLLLEVKERLVEKDWIIVNVDVTISAEEPRLEAYKPQMKRCVASLLGIDFNSTNVKAKTNEGLGPVGNGQAISAIAIALIKKKKKRSL